MCKKIDLLSPKKAPCIALLFLLLLPACEGLQQKGYDTKAIAMEVEDRKIKRITEGQLTEWINNTGKKITQILNKELENADPEAKLSPPSLDSLSNTFKVSIYHIAFDTPSSKLHPKEQEVKEAYEYNLEKGLSVEENIQMLDQDEFLFTAPLTVGKTTKGMWSIRFTRKESVRKINVKELRR